MASSTLDILPHVCFLRCGYAVRGWRAEGQASGAINVLDPCTQEACKMPTSRRALLGGTALAFSLIT